MAATASCCSSSSSILRLHVVCQPAAVGASLRRQQMHKQSACFSLPRASPSSLLGACRCSIGPSPCTQQQACMRLSRGFGWDASSIGGRRRGAGDFRVRASLYVDEDDQLIEVAEGVQQLSDDEAQQLIKWRQRVAQEEALLAEEQPPRLPAPPVALAVGVANIPHKDKAAKGGEDAWFISRRRGGAIGVSDGVSGCAADGVDPKIFAQQLMSSAQIIVEDGEADGHPRRMLALSQARTTAPGAATMCVITLSPEGDLVAGNLGDSGFRIIRNDRIVYSSPVLEHYFNCPLQFASDGSFKFAADLAVDADVIEYQLRLGDTILLATDGLWDNLFDKEVVTIVQENNKLRTIASAQQTATALAERAAALSRDVKYESPFYQRAVTEGEVPLLQRMFTRMRGGKEDDITVIVANVVSSSDVPEYVDTDELRGVYATLVSEVLSSPDDAEGADSGEDDGVDAECYVDAGRVCE
eukprot:jgi/Chlat1/6029/Chrsp4S06327